jgi:hypothetical protein
MQERPLPKADFRPQQRYATHLLEASDDEILE